MTLDWMDGHRQTVSLTIYLGLGQYFSFFLFFFLLLIPDKSCILTTGIDINQFDCLLLSLATRPATAFAAHSRPCYSVSQVPTPTASFFSFPHTISLPHPAGPTNFIESSRHVLPSQWQACHHIPFLSHPSFGSR